MIGPEPLHCKKWKDSAWFKLTEETTGAPVAYVHGKLNYAKTGAKSGWAFEVQPMTRHALPLLAMRIAHGIRGAELFIEVPDTIKVTTL